MRNIVKSAKFNAERTARRAETFFEAIASAVSHRLLSNIVGAGVMLNLLIAIMGDTYERVCSTDEFVECNDLAGSVQAKHCQIRRGARMPVLRIADQYQ